MTHFDPNEKLRTKEEALDYMETYGIMTDATFPNLNDDMYTRKRMAPVYEYLASNGLNISHAGYFDIEYGFGAVYFMYDTDLYPNLSDALAESRRIIHQWSKYQTDY